MELTGSCHGVVQELASVIRSCHGVDQEFSWELSSAIRSYHGVDQELTESCPGVVLCHQELSSG